MLCGLNAMWLIVRLLCCGAVVGGEVVAGVVRTVAANGGCVVGCVVGCVEGGGVAAGAVAANVGPAAAAVRVEVDNDFAVVVTPFAVDLVVRARTAGFDRCDFDVVVLWVVGCVVAAAPDGVVVGGPGGGVEPCQPARFPETAVSDLSRGHGRGVVDRPEFQQRRAAPGQHPGGPARVVADAG
jgi:hypothetical protein